MEKLIPFGRVFFAIAFIGLGIQHFIFGEFITGRAPEWEGILFEGSQAWAYVSGVAIIVTGFAILSGLKARPFAILAGILIFVWAFLRHLPVITGDSFLSPAWTGAGKALTIFGGVFAIAGTMPYEKSRVNTTVANFVNLGNEFITLGRVCLGIFLLITGIQHFMFTEFVASLIPAWFPGDAVFWTWFGGIALIAGGLGLLISKTARLAALLSGLMVFSWFWIIHIPRAFVSESDGISVFEALAVSGIAFVIAGFLYNQKKLQIDYAEPSSHPEP